MASEEAHAEVGQQLASMARVGGAVGTAVAALGTAVHVAVVLDPTGVSAALRLAFDKARALYDLVESVNERDEFLLSFARQIKTVQAVTQSLQAPVPPQPPIPHESVPVIEQIHLVLDKASATVREYKRRTLPVKVIMHGREMGRLRELRAQLSEFVSILTLAQLVGRGSPAAIASLQAQIDQLRSRGGDALPLLEHLIDTRAVVQAVASRQSDALERVREAVGRLSERGLDEADAQRVGDACAAACEPLLQQNRSLYVLVTALRGEAGEHASIARRTAAVAVHTDTTVNKIWEYVQRQGLASASGGARIDAKTAFAGIEDAVTDEMVALVSASPDRPPAVLGEALIAKMQDGTLQLTGCPIAHLPYTPSGDGRPRRLPCRCVVSARAERAAFALKRPECPVCHHGLTLGDEVTDDETTLFHISTRGGRSSIRVIPLESLEAVTDSDGRPSKLGQGGEGGVYLQRWTAKDGTVREVAVKELAFDARDAAARACAREECKGMLVAWQLACVASDLVCALHGVCWLTNAALVVMELHPRTLQDYLQEHKRENPDAAGLPRAEVVRISLELATALHALHTRARCMHLDVKPGNVLLTGNLSVRLADFGLSRDIRTRATSTRARAGTAGYAPLELMLDGRGRVESDAFSLGATILFCATGKHPFQGQTEVRIVRALEAAEHLPLPNDLLDADLGALVGGLTRRAPEDRMKLVCALDELTSLATPREAQCSPVRHPAAVSAPESPLPAEVHVSPVPNSAAVSALQPPLLAEDEDLSVANEPSPPAAAAATTEGDSLHDSEVTGSAKGEYTYVLHNFTSLAENKHNQKHFSEEFEIAGYSWKLLVFPAGRITPARGQGGPGPCISCYLEASDAKYLPHVLQPYCQFHLAAINHDDPAKNFTRDTTHNFSPMENDWGFTQFMQLETLNSGGFLKDDALHIKVVIEVQLEDKFTMASKTWTGVVCLKNQDEVPSVAHAALEEARIMSSRGLDGEALPLARRAVAIFTKALGAEHAQTAASVHLEAQLVHNCRLAEERERLAREERERLAQERLAQKRLARDERMAREERERLAQARLAQERLERSARAPYSGRLWW